MESSYRAWKNRVFDERSNSELLWPAIKNGTIVWGVGFLLTNLSRCANANANSFDNIFSDPVLIFFTLPATILVMYVAIYSIYYFANQFDLNYFGISTTVNAGHKAAILCRGSYTGEVAGSGFLVVPHGFDWEIFDCRPQSYEISDEAVRCSDGFAVGALIRASVRINDIFKSKEVENIQKTVSHIMKMVLNEALVCSPAFDIIESRASINVAAERLMNSKLSNYGLCAEMINIDIRQMPQVLTDFVSVMDVLKRRFTNSSPEELRQFLMEYLGKSTSKSHFHKYEVVGLEDVLRAAANRFQ